jgi:Na+/proline symporter
MTSQLSPTLVVLILGLYFIMLLAVAWVTGRNVGNEGFFLANRRVPWYVIAYAMIGTSISGVTFISLPGKVGAGGLNMGFSYMKVVLGYLLGYLFIGTILTKKKLPRTAERLGSLLRILLLLQREAEIEMAVRLFGKIARYLR